MSTVFYGYMVPNFKLWDVIQEVREYYKENHPVYQIVEKLYTRDLKGSELFDLIGALAEEEKVTLQLFQHEGHYIIRVLESGYYFMNNHTKFADLVPVFYDNRSDMTDEMKPNEKYADIVDDLIDKRQYLLYPLLDKDVVFDYAYEVIFKKE